MWKTLLFSMNNLNFRRGFLHSVLKNWWIDEIRRKRMSRLMTCRTHHWHNGFFFVCFALLCFSVLVFAEILRCRVLAVRSWLLFSVYLFFEFDEYSFRIHARNRNWNFRAQFDTNPTCQQYQCSIRVNVEIEPPLWMSCRVNNSY